MLALSRVERMDTAIMEMRRRRVVNNMDRIECSSIHSFIHRIVLSAGGGNGFGQSFMVVDGGARGESVAGRDGE